MWELDVEISAPLGDEGTILLCHEQWYLHLDTENNCERIGCTGHNDNGIMYLPNLELRISEKE